MKPRVAILTMGASLALVGPLAHGQQVRVGLWELKVQIVAGGKNLVGLQTLLADIDPAARERMNEWANERPDVIDGVAADGSLLKRVCVTKEMASRGLLPMPLAAECTHHPATTIGNRRPVSFSCPTGSGKGTAVILNDRDVRMEYATDYPEKTSWGVHGRWLKSECGRVKPTQ